MVRYQYIYLVCGNTMCVSTCQVEFVLWRTVFLYSTTAEYIDQIVWETSQFVLLFNYYLGRRYRKFAGTTALAYSIEQGLLTAWLLPLQKFYQ